MITFEPLWDTLKEKGISQYKLIKEYNISTGQLDRLRKNGNVNTYTLNQLCKILQCKLEDIAIYTDPFPHDILNIIYIIQILRRFYYNV